MKADYELVRPTELTLHEHLMMCQEHAERFIAGSSSCRVLDDSRGEITAIRKGDEIVMDLGLYDACDDGTKWYDVGSVPYDDDAKVLRAWLAGSYADVIYQFSYHIRFIYLPVSCKCPPPQRAATTSTDTARADHSMRKDARQTNA